MATALLTSTASCSSPFHYSSCPYAAHHHTFAPPSFTPIPLKLHVLSSPRRTNRLGLAIRSQAAVSPAHGQGAYDLELRSVLDLATDSELRELDDILFGPSYFSPLLKSVAKRAEVDYVMIEQDLDQRDDFIAALESRFLFLAADARSTLRGWRPSYRDVLLAVRKKLSISCSTKLSTEDLEAEVFLHLVNDFSSEESGTFPGLWESSKPIDGQGSLELGLSTWKLQGLGALKEVVEELQPIILKLAGKLMGKVVRGAANYQIKKEIVKKGGQLAAMNLEARAALIAAKQGLAGAASKYMGLRSAMSLLGPIMWGTLLADVVIQMLGTDYARVLRAVYAFAQIRLTRTYRPQQRLQSNITNLERVRSVEL
ncbi:hypothetical protein LINGRAHAP2_LOCUS22857 [Linum grandiflorum]